MAFTPVERRRLSDRIVDQLTELIRSGAFGVGEKLPSERELAASLGVSRPLVRESFRTLESLGLVEVKRGVGAIVTSAEPAEPDVDAVAGRETPDVHDVSNDSRGAISYLERTTILDILEAREVLEVQIVELASERISDEEAVWLREAAERYDSWRDNHRFHAMLASITHNFMLERLVVMQLELLQGARQRSHYGSPDSAESLLREHCDIAEAVIAHDVERAQRLMRDHFRHTRHSVISGREPIARQGSSE